MNSKQRYESWTSYNNRDREQITKWMNRMQSVIKKKVRSHQKLVNEGVFQDFWLKPIWEGEKRREEDFVTTNYCCLQHFGKKEAKKRQ